MALKVFVDFDGTITREDVGNAFFGRFGGAVCDAIVDEFRNGSISARECFRKEVEAIGVLDMQEAGRFVRSRQIDESFGEFVRFCRQRNIEFHIVSDGLDYYIREILTIHGLHDISYFANRLEVSPPDSSGRCRAAVRFPYSDVECSRCACCKRNIILTHTGGDDIIVYVGEGYSDRCPALYADIVFAKDELQTFCQRENISYFVYDSFRDVVKRLELLHKRKTLRKRRRAELKRREVFMHEP